MNYAKLLTRAGVPAELHAEAIACLASAKKRAWRLGIPVNLAADQPQRWQADGVEVYRCGQAWLINAKRFLVPIHIGYEIDNLWRAEDNVQLWYPIPGHDLRAPLTWSLFS